MEKIPFLPIQFFKSHAIKTGEFKPEVTFESSGTTGNNSSKHHLKSRKLYEKSFKKAFKAFYGNIKDYCVLALLPSYLERNNSSLIYMVDNLIKVSEHKDSGFYLYNHTDLKNKLDQLADSKAPCLLIGVSFALLDFIEEHQLTENPNLMVMETGGMKGRRKELIREELHQKLCKGFQLPNIHSEYGMTELLSQAYSTEKGQFKCPPWMKAIIRKQDDPFAYATKNETGAINIIDLANLYSVAFIQTDDLGKSISEDKFEVLGRFDQSDVRGCNLLI